MLLLGINASWVTESTCLAVAVRVEYIDDALHERVLLQLRQRHELVDGERARVVQVQLAEPLAQPPDLVGVDWNTHRVSAAPSRCTHTRQSAALLASTDTLLVTRPRL